VLPTTDHRRLTIVHRLSSMVFFRLPQTAN
jgi:hypothetical protein